ncbi:MAG: CDP-alcohol phosphatidyltransferase family protein [Rouxiella aceris]|uniref:CDP-alcohol phosphatidyltransferase family protein n=1 Tax=Rouxiella aceris TaxID=2703884 RepID=UPI00284F9333|nr:CDP-alcohol phosphatidyltransferase family protein [Rouxiella aceris]MDR3433316.1 CDP-alcohol phosphatidyltransferase family protein [Rouxiella aceris]
MTLYNIKPKFQNILRPLVIKLHHWGVTANQITVLAMLGSLILGGILIYRPEPLLFCALPVFLFLRMALNAIDGMLARECNQQTPLGALLNEVGDIISHAALYLSFGFLAGVPLPLVVLVVLLSWLSEFCGVMAQTLTGQRDYRGPLGKSDRAFLFGALGLMIALWPQGIAVVNSLFITAAMLLIWTVINRCRSAVAVRHD